MNTNIRNFCIIAHIDHGKSTLADRLIDITNAISKRDRKHSQMLDTMELEQERGITIKLQPIRLNRKNHQLNLIDTPGHVDFQYEVSRSLACVEGALLVVDATQGIEAQTISNVYLAMENNLEIIPVINKIDLPASDVNKVMTEIENTFGIDRSECLQVSAKTGQGVEELLDTVIEKLPAPKLKEQTPDKNNNRALIFDSNFDIYRGVVANIRIFDGELKKGDKIKFMATGKEVDILELGYFNPTLCPLPSLKTGEVGYIITGLKDVKETKVGDTVIKLKEKEHTLNIENIPALDGYEKVTPFVFAGVYPIDTNDFEILRDSLDKLSLNDASLFFEPESSQALGFGFRVGFLGLLHMEIIQERLFREYDLDLIFTTPNVSYKVEMSGKIKEQFQGRLDENDYLVISTPELLPEPNLIDQILEPWVEIEVIVGNDYLGNTMQLCEGNRATFINMNYLDENRVLLKYEIPLANIIIDFYDRLKSVTAGYSSFSYNFLEYRPGDLVKLNILVAGDIVDALSTLVFRDDAQRLGGQITTKLKTIIPRQQFPIALQAAIGGKIIARETISAFRKDVTAKLYGGDRSRKDKLLKKQKAGKKRMKQFGRVDIPQEAFIQVLKQD